VAAEAQAVEIDAARVPGLAGRQGVAVRDLLSERVVCRLQPELALRLEPYGYRWLTLEQDDSTPT
jgi:hypothetical protein